MKMLSLFRMSSALAIVMFASSFTNSKELNAVPQANVRVVPPVTVTETINIPWTSQTATATLTYGSSGSSLYQITASINGTSLTNLSLALVNHQGGTINVDTFQTRVVDPAGGYEYDIEVKVSGVVGGQWRIQSFTVEAIVN
ncbi:hypothetical protein SAMN05421820_106267 [Pedobacter steynii]|uniref:Uncharacterized protein n=1 Tax=Pedobacter steynii TaxID=430522 RepID=A0A1G9YWY0_9SPHI|nr:hypothetical protein [Pedobacter steynii]NQX39866.1 hypothetical protein [Pedobacter steynii]SDN13660.1 hypothetical protein SAMN05421820_106267 [Pedobacter steynii]